MATYFVSSGVNSDGIILRSSDYLRVLSGGKVQLVTVSSGGRLHVSSTGAASRVSLYHHGSVHISGGNVSNVSALESKTLVDMSGGVLSAVQLGRVGVVTNSAILMIHGGAVSSALIYAGGTARLSGGSLDTATVMSGGWISAGGGTVTNASVSSGGRLFLFQATASNVSLCLGASANLLSGGVISKGTVFDDAQVKVSSGGRIEKLKFSKGVGTVFSGGSAVSNTLERGAVLTLSGEASHTTLQGTNGIPMTTLNISLGGLAVSTTVRVSAVVNVGFSGRADSTFVSSGGLLSVSSGTVSATRVSAYGTMTVMSNGLADGTFLFGKDATAAKMIVDEHGVASRTTVASLGSMVVSSRGYAGDVEVQGGGKLFCSGSADDVRVASGGIVSVCGTMTDAQVSGGGQLSINAQGLVSRSVISSGGTMSIWGKGTSWENTLEFSGTMTVGNGGLAYRTTVSNSASLEIANNCVASMTTVSAGGRLTVSTGGTASGTVLAAGTADIFGSSVQDTVYQNGHLIVRGTATGASVRNGGHAWARLGGRLENATVFAGGMASATNAGVLDHTVVSGQVETHSGGSAVATVLAAGRAVAGNNGVFSATEVRAGALLSAGWGGKVLGGTVSSGGSVTIGASGVLGGVWTLQEGCAVNVKTGGAVVFDLASLDAPANVPMLSDLSLVGGTPDYRVTVSTAQNTGNYLLAAGAGDFAGSITVRNTDGTVLGTLSAGEDHVMAGTHYCRLRKADDTLLLSVTTELTEPPEVLSVFADTTLPTNQDVTVKATFVADATSKEYSRNGSYWQPYTPEGVNMMANGTLYFRCSNSEGTSPVVSYEVTNIDKVSPAAPTVKVSTTKPTNQGVVITATFSADSQIRQYSQGSGPWQTYTGPVTATENDVWNFRGIDAAGNISTPGCCQITNIDKTPPSAPTVTAGTVAPTNQPVTLTASFSNDSVQKRWSDNGVTWKEYTGPVKVKTNGDYRFAGIDAAGNWSDSAVFTVDYIDMTPPGQPHAQANTTEKTAGPVVLDVTFEGGLGSKQYSLDQKTWLAYTGPLSVTANGNYFFRCTDLAGNISKTEVYTVNNIVNSPEVDPVIPIDPDPIDPDPVDPDPDPEDTTPSAAPTVKASTSKPTNQNVTLTATFSADSAKKQYSTDKKTWKSYTGALSVTANGTWYFRALDAAGNISKITSFTVANIDKTPPAAPKVKADITRRTGLNVTVTATFSADSAKKQYSTDGKTWKSCTGKVVMKENGTLRFRAVDAVGNVSKVTSYKVSNIDSSIAAPGRKIAGAVSADGPYQFDYEMELSSPGLYSLSGDFGTMKGKVTISGNGKKAASGTIKNGVLVFNKNKPVLLDSAVRYTLSVVNSDKGKSASAFHFTLNAAALFDKGDTGDDLPGSAKSLGTVSSAKTLVKNGWVGYGDAVDCMTVKLETAASLCFAVESDDKVTFALSVVANPAKSLQKLSVKTKNGVRVGTASKKPLLLTAGTYLLSVTSTNAMKGGNASYSLSLDSRSLFFPKGDNSNDTWQAASAKAGIVKGKTVSGWVGYGDAADFYKLESTRDGFLSVDLNAAAAGAVAAKQLKLTLLDAAGKKIALAAVDGDTFAVKKEVAAGVYYLGVNCANVKKFNTSYGVSWGMLA